MTLAPPVDPALAGPYPAAPPPRPSSAGPEPEPAPARRPRPRLSVPATSAPMRRAAAVTAAVARVSRSVWRRSLVTPLGWAAVLSAVVMFVIGADQGWIEFRAVAVVLAAALVLAVAMTFGRPSYDVRIDVDRTRVRAGEELMGRVVIRRRTGRSVTSGTFDIAVGPVTASFGLPGLRTGEEHERGFIVPARRRGVVPIGPVRSVQGDPLGLLRRVQTWSDVTTVYVHPAVVRLDAGTAGLLHDVEGVTTQQISAADFSFHSLRDYQSGDDPRSIHWLTTARLDREVVRRYEETRRAHMVVVLDLDRQAYRDDEEFEVAVSSAASLGLLALREDRQLSVVTQARELACLTSSVLLDEFSAVDAGPVTETLPSLVGRAVRTYANASVVAVVTGSVASPDTLRRVALSTPLDARSYAVRSAQGAELARRRIGQTTVVDLPALAVLRRAMRGV